MKSLRMRGGDVGSIVTKADIESEEKIVEILKENFPDHNILGEENAKINNNSIYMAY